VKPKDYFFSMVDTMMLIGIVHDYLNRMLNNIPEVKVHIIDIQIVMALELNMIYGFLLGQFRDGVAF